MRRGIDVSELNGEVNWRAVKDAGIGFAIIRLGYGNGHLDANFYKNVNAAIYYGLDIGVYFYSYALDEEDAKLEAAFVIQTLLGCGLPPEKLPMGLWFDMEDDDGYKARHGGVNKEVVTQMCFEFILACNRAGYNAGVYANLDWLTNVIDTDMFAEYVPFWCAQWGSKTCDFPRATLWQYTDSVEIDGKDYDGDYEL